MTRALGFKPGRLRLTVPSINDNFCAGNLSWSPWLVLWLSSEGKTGETQRLRLVLLKCMYLFSSCNSDGDAF
jgi:hypothetical protein